MQQDSCRKAKLLRNTFSTEISYYESKCLLEFSCGPPDTYGNLKLKPHP